MGSQLSEIAELKARLDELERAHVTASRKQLTNEERRAIVTAVNEYGAEWFDATASGTKEKAQLVAERDRIWAEAQAKIRSMNARLAEIDHAVSVAGERYRSFRDPLWAELHAGTAALRAELLKVLAADESRACALVPMGLSAYDAKSGADVASRDRRLAGLRALRQEVENYWKLPDSEGEIRAQFQNALSKLPKVTVTRGPFNSPTTEFALAGGGLMTGDSARVTH